VAQENVEVVRRVYEVLNSQRAFPRELFAADFVADVSEVSLDVRELHGIDATQQAFARYFGTFDDFHVAAEVLGAGEETVVTTIRDGGRISGSSAEVWNHYFHAWTVRGGKVVRLSSHTDRVAALRAAGLAEKAGDDASQAPGRVSGRSSPTGRRPLRARRPS
jgi:ketosteroid isomerase-like protein